jgi:GNAT superfamily N-acetyltransferase
MEFRPATEADLPAIVGLLADDELGRGRELASDPLPRDYHDAFAAMTAQAGNRMIVAVVEGSVVGCLQLTVIRGLSRRGMTRAQIEAVRVARGRQGAGIGGALLRHAIELARGEGCRLVQLTTDRSRGDAHRFYERLGFVASHVGMKLAL